MKRKKVIIGFRLCLSLLAFCAVITQFVIRDQTKPFDPINFFSYFTIESNILLAAILAVSCFTTTKDDGSEQLEALRGAATVYIVTTGLVYFLLLRGLEESLQTPNPWANVVLHYIMPIGGLLDWVLNPPIKRMTWKQIVTWFIFPLLYVTYSLVRGPIVDWYPYPFLDPRVGGYGNVLMYSIVIVIGMGLLSVIVSRFGRATVKIEENQKSF